MILYTSASKRQILKQTAGSIIASVLSALFGAVYELFSHEVYSYYMIYAFAIPLVMCALPYILFILFSRNIPSTKILRIWNAGVCTFTVGCIFEGVLEIYGTTNRLIIVYPAAGIILCTTAIVMYFVFLRRKCK